MRPPKLTTRNRALVALLVGCAYASIAALKLHANGQYALAYDYTLHWWAGDALRRGYSPYAVINAWSPLYPFCSGYLYWLPTAVILEPLVLLPMRTAMPIFAGVSTGTLAYSLTQDGWWRLPFIGSAPVLYAAMGGVVVPFVVAAMLTPSLGWLAPMKYTTAAAGFAYNLSRRYAILGAAVVVASIAIWPWWPRQWFAELHDVNGGPYYHVPLLLMGGPLLLLAAIKWRRPEARLLFVMACLPQTMLYYDQLPLLVVAENRRQALTMTTASYLPVFILVWLHGFAAPNRAQLFAWNAPIILACYYLPCLAVVLLRQSPVTAKTGHARVASGT